MRDGMQKKAKMNIGITLLSQIVTLLCGLIVPNLMIGSFGSEAYGATTSIAQFLAYITLLEGGIGGVARAALYEPLANNNTIAISNVIAEIKRFFRKIAYIFIVYVIILACAYKTISNIQCFDWISTAELVIVISISTFAQYSIGISYSVLLQADQKTYIVQAISVITTILNTLLIVVLTKIGSNLIVVKLVSSVVFALRPIAMWIYVKNCYDLPSTKGQNDSKALKQKWNALSQHIAYFLHSNTDVVVLTVLKDLETVAVYAIYNMIVSNVQNLITSFAAGMEAVFGELYAKKEIRKLNDIFGYYETMLSIVSLFFMIATTTLIIPFVRLYTRNVHDVNYIVPIFAVLLILSSMIFCLRFPYHSVVIAAGEFKETEWASYGEAIANITVSVVLVKKFGLVGVASGTVAAVVFRFLFYVWYLSKNVICRDLALFIKRTGVNIGTYIIGVYLGDRVVRLMIFDSYFDWIKGAIGVSVLSMGIVLMVISIFYKKDVKELGGIVLRKLK